eukprot:4216281-Lingulodinium_polyedra.AAC.1
MATKDSFSGAVASIQSALPSSSSTATVKKESVQFEEMKAALATMKKHKVAMEKMLSEIKDCSTEMEVSSGEDQSLMKKVEQLN